MDATINPEQKRAPAMSIQLAMLHVLLIVLTLSLWKGWFEENYFLDCQIDHQKALIASCATSNDFITAGPGAGMTHGQYTIQIDEREHRYHERQDGQLWKLIPLSICLILELFFLWSARAKARAELFLRYTSANRKTKTFAFFMGLLIGTCGTIPSWLICGHAQTGLWVASLLTAYVFWILKPVKNPIPPVAGRTGS